MELWVHNRDEQGFQEKKSQRKTPYKRHQCTKPEESGGEGGGRGDWDGEYM